MTSPYETVISYNHGICYKTMNIGNGISVTLKEKDEHGISSATLKLPSYAQHMFKQERTKKQFKSLDVDIKVSTAGGLALFGEESKIYESFKTVKSVISMLEEAYNNFIERHPLSRKV